MAIVKFNDKGEMINADTGQLMKKAVNGKLSFNSDAAPMKTLQELGVKQPQPPPEEDEDDKKNKSNENDIKIVEFNTESKNEEVSDNSKINYNNLRKNKSKYQIN